MSGGAGSSVALSHKRGLATTRAATWAGAATVFMAISRAHNHSLFLSRIGIMGLAGMAAVGLLALTMSRWRPQDLRRHWIPKMVAFLVFVAIIGVPFALYPGQAFDFLTQAYVRTVLIGVITFAIARTAAGARLMAKVVASAGLTAIFLALHVNGVNTEGRLEGAYTYDPNDLSLISVVTLPLVVWWITDRSSKFGKWLIPTVPVILWVIIRTDSRSGFLGLAAVTIGFLILAFKWAPARIKKAGRWVLVGMVAGSPFVGAEYFQRVESITDEDDYNRNSPSGRVQVWKRGIGYALSNPVLGVGLHNFSTAEGRLSEMGQRRAERGDGWKWSAAHNSFLQVFTELGLVAGVVFLVLVLRTAYTLTLWYRNRERIRGPPDLLPPFLGLSFVGYAVTGFFLSFAYYDILYVLLGLACAVMLTDEDVRNRRRALQRQELARRQVAARPRSAAVARSSSG